MTLEIDLKEKRYKVLLKYYQQDDIEDNNGPIDWLSDPVFTSIANLGNIRVKIDMQDANKAIRRNKHVIPTVEELRYDLNDATIFSVVV